MLITTAIWWTLAGDVHCTAGRWWTIIFIAAAYFILH